MRRKTNKKRIGLTRSLLKLLKKFTDFESQLRKSRDIDFKVRYYRWVTTIKKICQQQQAHFRTGRKIKDRIVSISKDYIRPIVRGKEVKPVEFGAKVNKVQTDGINFMENISFDAFNEGTRLRSTVYKTQSLPRKS